MRDGKVQVQDDQAALPQIDDDDDDDVASDAAGKEQPQPGNGLDDAREKAARLRAVAEEMADMEEALRSVLVRQKAKDLKVRADDLRREIKRVLAERKTAAQQAEAEADFTSTDTPKETLDEASERLSRLSGAEFEEALAEATTAFRRKHTKSEIRKLAEAKRQEQHRKRPRPSGQNLGNVTLPPGFKLDTGGLWFQSETNDDDSEEPSASVWVCGPFTVVSVSSDDGGEDHGLLLEWDDDQKCHHKWPMPRNLVHAEGNSIAAELERCGLHCGTGQREHALLKRCLGGVRVDRHMRCVLRAGWHEDAFVLPDGQVFGSDHIIMQSAHHARNAQAFAVRGTLEEWQRNVAAMAVGNSRLTLSISAALSAPLMSLTNTPSSGFHHHGESRIGKSTLQACAASVYGPGVTKGGNMRSWYATANGLEGIAAERCDGLLAIEESGQLNAHDIAATVYMLFNEQGKTRADRTGVARVPAEWCIMVVSSGETTIAAKIAEARRSVPAGVEVRLLNIPADAGEGLGVWETLHDYESGRALTDYLRDGVVAYCGTAGPALLAKLVEERRRDVDALVKRLRGDIDKFVKKVVPKDASGQVLSAATRFGLVAAGGELAASFGIVQWQAGVATEAAETCFAAWLGARGHKSAAAEHIAVLREVSGFLGRHGSSRFSPADKPVPTSNKWGDTIEAGLPKIINQAGYAKYDGDDATEFWILPAVWRTEICAANGIDPAFAVKALKAKGLLLGATDRHAADLQRVWGRPTALRLYRVSAAILEEADLHQTEPDAPSDDDEGVL